jgi:M-phase inducer tyrosine phosphatase
MDVDTSFSMSQNAAAPSAFSPEPRTAHPSNNGFNSLFYNTLSPRRSFESPLARQGKNGRSVFPDTPLKSEQDLSSSPAFPPSPSDVKVDRMRNGKPMLQGLGAPSLFARRNRRPVVSAVVRPSDATQTASHGLPTEQLESGGLPVRRAFSAMLPPSFNSEQYSEESSFEGPDASSPAQAYTKRQQVRTIRRCDGSESLRSVTNAAAIVTRESPVRLNSSPMSKYMAPGLGGFGDNEAHGKGLPCHKVTEDGLMRIKPETVC